MRASVKDASNQKRWRRRCALLSTAAVAALPAISSAANLYWDVNGATAGGASTTTATGSWSSTNTNWSTDPLGAVATTVWGGAGNTAVFAAGTNVTGSYTVTVVGTQ